MRSGENRQVERRDDGDAEPEEAQSLAGEGLGMGEENATGGVDHGNVPVFQPLCSFIVLKSLPLSQGTRERSQNVRLRS